MGRRQLSYKQQLCMLMICIAIFCCNPFQGKAQLVVDNALTPQQLVQDVLVGSGLTVSNVTFTGFAHSKGKFTTGATPTNLGISTGIILSSGVVDAYSNGIYTPSPIGSPSSNQNSCNLDPVAGDADLNVLVPSSTTKDAAVIEFDFVPQSDMISFKYVFGSEEYPDYVFDSYNDIFAFFISGPNPSGGNYTKKNIALIPGTTTPVAINNVNQGNDNAGCTNCQYYVNNATGTTIVYDGFTKVLTASCAVVCNQTYHLKLAIADVEDRSFDSGVFLEAGSFSSNNVTLQTIYPDVNVSSTAALEGCSKAIVRFSVANAVASNLVLNYTVAGTATNGTDYPAVSGTVTIPAGQTYADVEIIPSIDGQAEGSGSGLETVEITYEACNNPQTAIVNILDNNQSSDNVTLQVIYPDVAINATAATEGCSKALVRFNVPAAVAADLVLTYTISGTATNGTDYSLLPGTVTIPAGQSFAEIEIQPVADGIAEGAGNGQETVSISFVSACNMQMINVTIQDNTSLSVQAGNDAVICTGEQTTLNAIVSGGTSPYTYDWGNGAGSSNQEIVSPSSAITYVVTVTDKCGSTATDNVTVNVNNSLVDAGMGGTICEDENITLQASGGTSYQWSNGLTGATITLSSLTPGIHMLYVEDPGTCNGIDSVEIVVNEKPTANFYVASTVLLESETAITYTGVDNPLNTYTWNFDNANIIGGSGAGPYQVMWETAGIKSISLEVQSPEGCKNEVTENIIVWEDIKIFIPNAFTPNNDLSNDEFIVSYYGEDLPGYSLSIYNRWGEMIFETEDINASWNGGTFETGVYCYVISFVDSFQEMHKRYGYVTLYR